MTVRTIKTTVLSSLILAEMLLVWGIVYSLHSHWI